MRSYKSTSTEKPPEWDTTSSPDIVYHNFNVAEIPAPAATPANEETPTMYGYDVDEYTRMEYMEYKNAEATEAIELILSGVTE